jgi:hypothetical protein
MGPDRLIGSEPSHARNNPEPDAHAALTGANVLGAVQWAQHRAQAYGEANQPLVPGRS